jgi:hypothetical protein
MWTAAQIAKAKADYAEGNHIIADRGTAEDIARAKAAQLLVGAAVGDTEGKSCASEWVEVTGSASSECMGLYKKLAGEHNGRPSYTKVSNVGRWVREFETRFLFFAGNMWVMGPRLGALPFEIAVASTARDPTTVRSMWSEVVGGREGELPLVKARCATAPKTTTAPPVPTQSAVELVPEPVTSAPSLRAEAFVKPSALCPRIAVSVAASVHASAAVLACVGDYYLASTDPDTGRAVRKLDSGQRGPQRYMYYLQTGAQWVVSEELNTAPYLLAVGGDAPDPNLERGRWHVLGPSGENDGVRVWCRTSSPTPAPTPVPTEDSMPAMEEPPAVTRGANGGGALTPLAAAPRYAAHLRLSLKLAAPKSAVQLVTYAPQVELLLSVVRFALASALDPLSKTIRASDIRTARIGSGTGWHGVARIDLTMYVGLASAGEVVPMVKLVSDSDIIAAGISTALSSAFKMRMAVLAMFASQAPALIDIPDHPANYKMSVAVAARGGGAGQQVAEQRTACAALKQYKCLLNRDRCAMRSTGGEGGTDITRSCDVDPVFAEQLRFTRTDKATAAPPPQLRALAVRRERAAGGHGPGSPRVLLGCIAAAAAAAAAFMVCRSRRTAQRDRAKGTAYAAICSDEPADTRLAQLDGPRPWVGDRDRRLPTPASEHRRLPIPESERVRHAIAAHAPARRRLVVGGGAGGAAREQLSHLEHFAEHEKMMEDINLALPVFDTSSVPRHPSSQLPTAGTAAAPLAFESI